MFKIIVPLFLATSLPILAQIRAGTDDASTTVTTTVTTDPMVRPAPTTARLGSEPIIDKTAEGVVAEVNPGAGMFSVIVPESDIAMKFVFNDQTKTVNLASRAVSWTDVKLGQSVTVTYFDKAGELVAKNVAFGDPAKLVPVTAVPATAVTTTAVVATTPVPVVTEKVTTTTTTAEEGME